MNALHAAECITTQNSCCYLTSGTFSRKPLNDQRSRCLSVLVPCHPRDARKVVDRIVVEDDPRYRRVDLAEVHAWEARRAFVETVAKGESGINLAEAALQVAAEDDAIVSHSTVRLPIQSFLQRIDRLASNMRSAVLQKMPEDAMPDDILQAIGHHLFTEQNFRVPPFRRSNIPSGVLVDHPGVYENAKYGYLHEALISRQGIPAVLAILLEQICQQLLTSGAIDFAVRVDCSALDRVPTATALPGLSRDMVTRPDGTVLNTCSTDVLVEMLRFIKRAYWPFGWQSGTGPSAGGFTSAAMVWLEGEARAELQAIARTAAHRLQRGIWTSPGAGDLRRALASAERLCIVLGDEAYFEWRDVAVLYLHAGNLPAALAHLDAYASTPAAKDAPREEQKLVERILEGVRAITDELDDMHIIPLLNLQSALETPRPEADTEQRTPLTW
ncbi:hypothetical protein CVIRNUC_002808 [Coccomyxa viridis]|uniref:Protein SirB1 N-terminal domain-containing protein n=1 Tax=Coccomyxa viridis TaxID=1274662 RepID=A0AAV1HXV5_9CHLO|nr:hypothetical protein CVIRNUC_002808 [Coccomyxa viridis]